MDGVLSIARTDAEGNTFRSARDLMPLMGYRNVNAWQPFRANVIRRAEKSAENTGMTCSFTHVSERAEREIGGSIRKDVHLDRMAAYLVAMNGDPNKPEVAAATPANYPRSVSAPTYSRVVPTSHNAPILHISAVTSANSTLLETCQRLPQLGQFEAVARPNPNPTRAQSAMTTDQLSSFQGRDTYGYRANYPLFRPCRRCIFRATHDGRCSPRR